jgi:hypothetical protein
LVVDVSVVEFRKFESLFVDDFGELQLSTIAVMAVMIISFMAIMFYYYYFNFSAIKKRETIKC